MKNKAKESDRDIKSNLIKFLIVLSIIIGYAVFASFKYGTKDGILITALTWSFFVLCTPVADGGFLIDLPLRLIFKIKMVYSEILVWVIAICLNLYAIFWSPLIYQKTFMLKIFDHILREPFPYWIVIFISAIGTFSSLFFSDEIVDELEDRIYHRVSSHHNRYQFIFFLFIIIMSVVLYKYLVKELGIDVPAGN